MPLGEAQGYAGLAYQPSDRYQGDLADAAAAPLEARTLAESRAGGALGPGGQEKDARRENNGCKCVSWRSSAYERARHSQEPGHGVWPGPYGAAGCDWRVTTLDAKKQAGQRGRGCLESVGVQHSERSGCEMAGDFFFLAVACACGRVEKSGCVLRGRQRWRSRQTLAGPGGGMYCRPSCAAAPRSIEKTLGKHLIHRPSSRHSPPTPYRKPTQSSPPSSIPPPAFPTACTTPSSTVEMANEVSPPPPRPRCPP